MALELELGQDVDIARVTLTGLTRVDEGGEVESITRLRMNLVQQSNRLS